MIDYETFEKYVKPSLPYDYNRGPKQVRTHEDAKLGVNCVALGHLTTKDVYGVTLPGDLKCYELFNDKHNFRAVDGVDEMLPGDLLWLGLKYPRTSLEAFVPVFEGGELVNWPDYPIEHVGIYTGEADRGDPLVLHACFYEGQTAIWPLSRFAKYPRYSEIHGITRYATELERSQTQPLAAELGTESLAIV